jgi:hypothetical protein
MTALPSRSHRRAQTQRLADQNYGQFASANRNAAAARLAKLSPSLQLAATVNMPDADADGGGIFSLPTEVLTVIIGMVFADATALGVATISKLQLKRRQAFCRAISCVRGVCRRFEDAAVAVLELRCHVALGLEAFAQYQTHLPGPIRALRPPLVVGPGLGEFGQQLALELRSESHLLAIAMATTRYASGIGDSPLWSPKHRAIRDGAMSTGSPTQAQCEATNALNDHTVHLQASLAKSVVGSSDVRFQNNAMAVAYHPQSAFAKAGAPPAVHASIADPGDHVEQIVAPFLSNGKGSGVPLLHSTNRLALIVQTPRHGPDSRLFQFESVSGLFLGDGEKTPVLSERQIHKCVYGSPGYENRIASIAPNRYGSTEWRVDASYHVDSIAVSADGTRAAVVVVNKLPECYDDSDNRNGAHDPRCEVCVPLSFALFRGSAGAGAGPAATAEGVSNAPLASAILVDLTAKAEEPRTRLVPLQWLPLGCNAPSVWFHPTSNELRCTLEAARGAEAVTEGTDAKWDERGVFSVGAQYPSQTIRFDAHDRPSFPAARAMPATVDSQTERSIRTSEFWNRPFEARLPMLRTVVAPDRSGVLLISCAVTRTAEEFVHAIMDHPHMQPIHVVAEGPSDEAPEVIPVGVHVGTRCVAESPAPELLCQLGTLDDPTVPTVPASDAAVSPKYYAVDGVLGPRCDFVVLAATADHTKAKMAQYRRNVQTAESQAFLLLVPRKRHGKKYFDLVRTILLPERGIALSTALHPTWNTKMNPLSVSPCGRFFAVMGGCVSHATQQPAEVTVFDLGARHSMTKKEDAAGAENGIDIRRFRDGSMSGWSTPEALVWSVDGIAAKLQTGEVVAFGNFDFEFTVREREPRAGNGSGAL